MTRSSNAWLFLGLLCVCGAGTAGDPSLADYGSLFAEADAWFAEGHYDSAFAGYRSIWQQSPETNGRARAAVGAGLALASLGKPDSAKTWYQRATNSDSTAYWWARAHYELAAMDQKRARSHSIRSDRPAQIRLHKSALSRARRVTAATRASAAADSLAASAHLAATHIIFDQLYRATFHTFRWPDDPARTKPGFVPRVLGELKAELDDAVSVHTTPEHVATLLLAYAQTLARINPGATTNERAARDRQLRDVEQHRVLRRLVDEHFDTPQAAEALRLLASAESDEPAEMAILKRLLASFPESEAAAQADERLRRMSTVEFSVDTLQQSFGARDSAVVRVTQKNLNQPIEIAVREVPFALVLGLMAQLPDAEFDSVRNKPPVLTKQLPSSGVARRQELVPLRLAPGYYVVEGISGDHRAMANVTVTDLLLLRGVWGDSTEVLLINSQAQPIAHHPIHVYYSYPEVPGDRHSVRMDTLDTLETDEHGRLVVELPKPVVFDDPGRGGQRRELGALLFTASRGEHHAILTQQLSRVRERSRIVVWTDRTLYQPGETVHFHALKLDGPAHALRPAAGQEVRVSGRFPGPVETGGRDASWDTTLVANGFGVASGTLRIPKSSADGPFRLSGRSGRIASFKRLDTALAVKPLDSAYAAGDTVELEIGARTHQAQPLAHARVEYVVSAVRIPRRFEPINVPRTHGWYRPVDGGPRLTRRIPKQEVVLERSAAMLDELGRHVLRIATAGVVDTLGIRAEQAKLPGLVVDVTLVDAAERRLTSWEAVPLYVSKSWCRGVPPISIPLHLEPTPIARIDNRNNLAPGPVFYRWIDRVADIARDTYIETVIDSGRVETGGSGIALLRTTSAPYSGALALEVRGDETAPYATRIAPSSQDKDGHTRQRAMRRAQLYPDRVQYALGDTVVLERPDGKKAPPCVIRRGEHALPLLAPESGAVRVGVDGTFIPSASLTIEPVHSGPDNPWRQHAKVVTEPHSRLLHVEVEKTGEKPMASDSVEVVVRVSNHVGRPVRAWVNVFAVDRAIYSIATDDFNLTRALFYLQSSSSSANTSMSTPVVAQPPARLSFRPTAFWAAAETEASTGRVALTLQIPDDIARWRLVARAVDLEGRVGEGESDFASVQPIQMRPHLPGVVRRGDQFEFSVSVDNLGDPHRLFVVDWHAPHLEPRGPQSVRVEVGQQQTKVARFAAHATDVAGDTLSIRLAPAGKASVQQLPTADHLRLALPVLEPGPPPLAPLSARQDRLTTDFVSIVRSTIVAHRDTPLGRLVEDIELLLCLDEARVLLSEEERRDLPELAPAPQRTLQFRARSLWSIRRAGREPYGHWTRQAQTLRDFALLEERGDWADTTHAIATSRDSLTEAVVHARMKPLRRLAVAEALISYATRTSDKELLQRLGEALDEIHKGRSTLGPGGLARLAIAQMQLQRAGGPTTTVRAAPLIDQAAQFATTPTGSSYAHFYVDAPGETRMGASCALLRTLAMRGTEHALISPLVNAIALDRASLGWKANSHAVPMLRAFMALEKLHRGRAYSPPIDFLSVERRVRVVPRGARRGEPTITGFDADTLSCSVGDTLVVEFKVNLVTHVHGLALESPVPGSCQPIAEPKGREWQYTNRAHAVRMHLVGGRSMEPGTTTIRHRLLVDRAGVFRLPEARVYLEQLPSVESRSPPLIVHAAR